MSSRSSTGDGQDLWLGKIIFCSRRVHVVLGVQSQNSAIASALGCFGQAPGGSSALAQRVHVAHRGPIRDGELSPDDGLNISSFCLML